MMSSKGSSKKDKTGEKLEDCQQSVLDEWMVELIDDVVCGLCFEVHRACKLGTFFLDESSLESQKRFEIANEKGRDVFGQLPSKKQFECICPSCHRNLAASRFAPHLEKCMGMGRISSRIASRRIATNTGKKESDQDSDENDDNDSSYCPDRKAKRLRKEKQNGGSSSKKKKSKYKNEDSPSISSNSKSSTSSSQVPSYESLSHDERKNLMLQICGVISEHTKKMCTRSAKCPQHTDSQRRSVRKFLLGSSSKFKVHGIVYCDSDIELKEVLSSIASGENARLDADSDDQPLLGWDEVTLGDSSPADSNSTINSRYEQFKKDEAFTFKQVLVGQPVTDK